MGSLVPGWDSRRGKVPRGFRDYEDPSPIPKDTSHLVGPPNLSRHSAPGRFYQVHVHHSPSSPRSTAHHNHNHTNHNHTHRRSLDRVSAEPLGSLPAPASPTTSSGSAAAASPFGTAPAPSSPVTPGHKLVVVERPHHLTAILHEKEHWCDRMDSASLNSPIDNDPGECWDVNKHGGSFVPDDPLGTMHLLHIHSKCPKEGENLEEEGSGGEGEKKEGGLARSPASVIEGHFQA